MTHIEACIINSVKLHRAPQTIKFFWTLARLDHCPLTLHSPAQPLLHPYAPCAHPHRRETSVSHVLGRRYGAQPATRAGGAWWDRGSGGAETLTVARGIPRVRRSRPCTADSRGSEIEAQRSHPPPSQAREPRGPPQSRTARPHGTTERCGRWVRRGHESCGAETRHGTHLPKRAPQPHPKAPLRPRVQSIAA